MKDYNMLSNKNLIGRCVSKDPLAWLEFVKRFKKLVAYAAEERLRRWNYNFSQSDVEDICQDVFLSIWERDLLTTLKNPDSVVAWLAIISANKAVNYFKLKSTPPPQALSIFPGEEKSDFIDTETPSPLEEMIFKDTFKNIISVIKTLSLVEKNILKLNILYEKSIKDIAMMLNMPLGTAYSIINRVKMKIRKNLKK